MFFFDVYNKNIAFVDAWDNMKIMLEKGKWNIFEIISESTYHKDIFITEIRNNYEELEQLISIMKTKDIYENILFLEMNGY